MTLQGSLAPLAYPVGGWPSRAPVVRESRPPDAPKPRLSALLFLFREVLEQQVPWLDDLVYAKRPHHLPVVLTREEVRAVLAEIHGVPRLMAFLLYGAGLRLLECARLRVKDIDIGSNQIVVRSGKGNKDRLTMLPAAIKTDLMRHLDSTRDQHQSDLQAGAGWVELPWALGENYPNAGREWPWQWVFPATRIYVDRVTGQRRRHHLHESVLQRAVKTAQELLGHNDVSTTMIYTHVLNQGPGAVRSPADRMFGA